MEVVVAAAVLEQQPPWRKRNPAGGVVSKKKLPFCVTSHSKTPTTHTHTLSNGEFTLSEVLLYYYNQHICTITSNLFIPFGKWLWITFRQ